MSIENGKRVWYIISELKERQVQTNENLTVAFLKKMNRDDEKIGSNKEVGEFVYIKKSMKAEKKIV